MLIVLYVSGCISLWLVLFLASYSGNAYVLLNGAAQSPFRHDNFGCVNSN